MTGRKEEEAEAKEKEKSKREKEKGKGNEKRVGKKKMLCKIHTNTE